MQDHELVEHMVRTWSPEGSTGSQARINDTERARESLIATDASGTDQRDTASHGISVNAVEISERDINIESANYEGGTILERQNQAAIALVIRELLLQRAAELELPATGEIMSMRTLSSTSFWRESWPFRSRTTRRVSAITTVTETLSAALTCSR
ncbi:MAG: hypothetical protein IPG06_10395 [Haliea sp.]|nr:hypothetical protein [Haliea sp.]